jgi:hypothetical protein
MAWPDRQGMSGPSALELAPGVGGAAAEGRPGPGKGKRQKI